MGDRNYSFRGISCPRTRKRRFNSSIDALVAASRIRTPHITWRAYKCEFCGGQHLTSQPRKTKPQ